MLRLSARLPDQTYHSLLVPCKEACPVHTDARGYIRAIAEGRFEDAYLIARGPNPFASICGRICAAPCEAACRRGKLPRLDEHGSLVGYDKPVAIRSLKRFACEQAGPEARPVEELLSRLQQYQPSFFMDAEEMAALLRSGVQGAFKPASGERVAIIGGGPAGLSAAHDLALMGFRPLVLESESVVGGMLAVGVPNYRLPRQIITREIEVIRALGVEIQTGVMVGQHLSFSQLRKDFPAVIIAVGAKGSRKLGLEGESGPGVYGGVDLLRSAALGLPLEVGREVVVVGGGNVAYDVARTVLRQIAYDTARTAARMPGMGKVSLVSLETLEEMPADTSEILEGDQEGIQRINGWGPVRILRDGGGAVKGVEFRKCHRVYDEQRRFAPVFDDSIRMTISCDTVLLAVGQVPNLSFLQGWEKEVGLVKPGFLKVDKETLSTVAPGVFAAGDIAHGTRLLIDAVASGKAVARSVYRHITGRQISLEQTTSYIAISRYQRERGYEAKARVPVQLLEPDQRLQRPDIQVELGYTRPQAMLEASRCLDCGVTPIFDSSRCLLCGGCVDVCPTSCLKLVELTHLDTDLPCVDGPWDCAILKDEERCIRCACCARRCPVGAITMERVTLQSNWSTERGEAAQGTEHRAQGTEHRAQGTEHGVEGEGNTEQG